MKSLLEEKKYESLKECLICEEEKGKGIHLLNYFICTECEHDIVTSDTDNSSYRYYLNRLKKVKEALMPSTEKNA
ncbi:sigma factor G inhibitor Gin [Evansella cellulosilytica]|uniref:Sigma-G inhibitor, Gin n=1 Tax=Evansella cellulosilytica (strain ATCC 21833 / DSM 2522 / FERM P-1141 / JCM 9156 / N-4) TaxID=649639 RepID=E6TRM6_EVAC2|nr:sigma factor G inhibitor Gin [Evansella cellulosilytica]ADU28320.1 Sigma-G inhibitor, Gin [Evansella cellulosilytica DSM 2522]